MPRKTAEHKITLQFGAAWLVPENAPAAWGARLIWPADLLHDRQGFYNWDTPEGNRLKEWLNKGALSTACAVARKMARNYSLTPESNDVVELHSDEMGTIKATPNRSFGYLYVAAWLNPEGK